MAGIPGVEVPRWYERHWVAEALGSVPPIILAAGTAVVLFVDPSPAKRKFGYLPLIGAIWLVVAAIVKVARARALDREERRKRNPEGLFAAAHILHQVAHLTHGLTPLEQGDLRVTVHRVVEPLERPDFLEQMIPYVGGGGGGTGRRFSIRSGIIGKAVREKTPYSASRQNTDYAQFIHELVAEWSYTEQDAKQLSQDRFAWMAVPIMGTKEQVIGVVYLDSKDAEYFTSEVKEAIIKACHGVSFYLTEKDK